MITWLQSYETGFPTVDAEHKRLVEAVNQLEQALLNGTAKNNILDTVLFLANYATRHFASEEAIMQRVKCPAHAENAQAHHELKCRIQDWMVRLRADPSPSLTLLLEVHRELAKWLRMHMLRVDCKLRGCKAA